VFSDKAQVNQSQCPAIVEQERRNNVKMTVYKNKKVLLTSPKGNGEAYNTRAFEHLSSSDRSDRCLPLAPVVCEHRQALWLHSERHKAPQLSSENMDTLSSTTLLESVASRSRGKCSRFS